MKKAIRILSAASIMLLSLACSRLEKFEHHSFVTFNDNEYVANEDAGSIKIPVTLYNCDNGANIIVKVVDGTAINGRDYTIAEPASGVLAFAKGETTKEITINITNHSGEYTGNREFTISLSSSDGVEEGNTTMAYVTIKDMDHPLADFAGNWTVNCTAALKGKVKYTMTLTLDDEDVTVVWCNFIVPMLYAYSSYGAGYVKGIVSEDKTTITFASQPLDARGGKAFDVGYGTFTLYSGTYKYVNGDDKDEYKTSQDPIIFTKAEGDGLVFKSKNGPCIIDEYVWPNYYGYILGEDNNEEVVWTKQ